MAGEKEKAGRPAVDMAGLMEMISAMGDGVMLTVEIATDAGAAHDDSGKAQRKGGGNGEK